MSLAVKTSLEKVKELYEEVHHLGKASAVLGWDQQIYMPPKGGEARGRQLATLDSLIHEKMTSEKLIDALGEAAEGELSRDERHYVEELQWQVDRATKLPGTLVKELSLQESKSYNVWSVARRDRNFSLFAPELEKLVALSIEKARCYGYTESPWDALAQSFERGMTAKRVDSVFSPLRDFSKDLLQKIVEAKPVDDGFLSRQASAAKQEEFALRVVRDIGFDLSRGRLDETVHPFCTNFSINDVRLTTRYALDSPMESVAAVIHEAGHGLYEQGFKQEDEGSPLAGAPSLGLHESQSRFWEVRVARSQSFWKHYLSIARQYFPGLYDDIDVAQFYRGINSVRPDLIRVEANEVTYNLHVIIRFELERAMIEGSLSVADLPGEWNRLYKEYLGVDVPHDGAGCLQDVHWSGGMFGYFPSYSFGNIYGAMLVEKMEEDLPAMWSSVEKGEFAEILRWLRSNIHEKGCRLDSERLVKDVTGKDISSAPLTNYLETKYSRIYNL